MPDSTRLGSPTRSALISALIHALAIVLILVIATSPHSPITNLIPVRDTTVYLPSTPRTTRDGGGGGQQSPLPVAKGQPPKSSPRVFTMPVMVRLIRETRPLIEMPPEVLGPPSSVPEIDLAHVGNPNGPSGAPSGGPGQSGGLGEHKGPGAGGKDGPGIGDGPGGNAIGGLPRKNSTRPELVSKTEPEYSEDARKAKIQGIVVLRIVVEASGQVSDIHVVHSLGLGLDERAIEAVRQWKFRPGTADGKPVSTTALVEVNFRLL